MAAEVTQSPSEWHELPKWGTIRSYAMKPEDYCGRKNKRDDRPRATLACVVPSVHPIDDMTRVRNDLQKHHGSSHPNLMNPVRVQTEIAPGAPGGEFAILVQYDKSVDGALALDQLLYPESGSAVPQPLSLTEGARKQYRQVLSGLFHLHLLSVRHLFLRPSNIFVYGGNPGDRSLGGCKLVLGPYVKRAELHCTMMSAAAAPPREGAEACLKKMEVRNPNYANRPGYMLLRSDFYPGMREMGYKMTSEDQLWMAPELQGLLRGDAGWRTGAASICRPRFPEKGRVLAVLDQLRACDVFSAGLILFYIATGGHHLFGDLGREDPERIGQRIRSGDPVNLYLLDSVKPLQGLVKSMTAKVGSQRPSPAACLLHPATWSAEYAAMVMYQIGDTINNVDLESNVECLCNVLEKIPKALHVKWYSDKKAKGHLTEELTSGKHHAFVMELFNEFVKTDFFQLPLPEDPLDEIYAVIAYFTETHDWIVTTDEQQTEGEEVDRGPAGAVREAAADTEGEGEEDFYIMARKPTELTSIPPPRSCLPYTPPYTPCRDASLPAPCRSAELMRDGEGQHGVSVQGSTGMPSCPDASLSLPPSRTSQQQETPAGLQFASVGDSLSSLPQVAAGGERPLSASAETDCTVRRAPTGKAKKPEGPVRDSLASTALPSAGDGVGLSQSSSGPLHAGLRESRQSVSASCGGAFESGSAVRGGGVPVKGRTEAGEGTQAGGRSGWGDGLTREVKGSAASGGGQGCIPVFPQLESPPAAEGVTGADGGRSVQTLTSSMSIRGQKETASAVVGGMSVGQGVREKGGGKEKGRHEKEYHQREGGKQAHCLPSPLDEKDMKKNPLSTSTATVPARGAPSVPSATATDSVPGSGLRPPSPSASAGRQKGSGGSSRSGVWKKKRQAM